MVPWEYDLELVQQLLGHPLHLERRNPLLKWRDLDVRDDANDKTAGFDFGHVVDFPFGNPRLDPDGLLHVGFGLYLAPLHPQLVALVEVLKVFIGPGEAFRQ